MLLSTKNLTLPGICKLQKWFVGPFRVQSTGLGTFHLDLPPSMATGHLWFHTRLLKPAGPQPAGPTVLADDSYEVEAILQINKHEMHAKVKWLGYDSSHKQYIRISELKNTAFEVVKTFLREKK